MIFEQYLNDIQEFLQLKQNLDVERVDDLILCVSHKEYEFPIFTLNYELEEVKIGISNVQEYYPVEELEKAIWRFLTLLTQNIRITAYYKGSFFYRGKFDVIDNQGNVYYFGDVMTWLFPFWKKSRLKVKELKALLTLEEIEERFINLKIAANKV